MKHKFVMGSDGSGCVCRHCDIPGDATAEILRYNHDDEQCPAVPTHVRIRAGVTPEQLYARGDFDLVTGIDFGCGDEHAVVPPLPEVIMSGGTITVTEPTEIRWQPDGEFQVYMPGTTQIPPDAVAPIEVRGCAQSGAIEICDPPLPDWPIRQEIDSVEFEGEVDIIVEQRCVVNGKMCSPGEVLEARSGMSLELRVPPAGVVFGPFLTLKNRSHSAICDPPKPRAEAPVIEPDKPAPLSADDKRRSDSLRRALSVGNRRDRFPNAMWWR